MRLLALDHLAGVLAGPLDATDRDAFATAVVDLLQDSSKEIALKFVSTAQYSIVMKSLSLFMIVLVFWNIVAGCSMGAN